VVCSGNKTIRVNTQPAVLFYADITVGHYQLSQPLLGLAMFAGLSETRSLGSMELFLKRPSLSRLYRGPSTPPSLRLSRPPPPLPLYLQIVGRAPGDALAFLNFGKTL
jgi:hypothetical protein